jgi:ABC-type nitrate/sulfonate/bicarbonate transport system substrate-binding protein
VRRVRLVAFSRHPVFVAAVEAGLFAAEGIEVAFTRAPDSATQLAGLADGAYDVAHTAADNIVARVDGGADLRIALVPELGTDQRLVGAPGVRSSAEVRGRTLGVDAIDSGHALFAYALLAEAGVERGSYDVLPVGSTPRRQVALLEGRIDAAMLSLEDDERIMAAGCHVLADAATRFPGHPGISVAVRGRSAVGQRDLIVSYCRALLGGARAVAAARGRRVPTVSEMATSIGSVCALRNTVGLRRGPIDASRYFDASLAREAGA